MKNDMKTLIFDTKTIIFDICVIFRILEQFNLQKEQNNITTGKYCTKRAKMCKKSIWP